MMDDETRAYLAEMEARLMARMNDNQERLLERMRSAELSIAGLTELARSTNTLLTLIATSQADLARRITDLERKP